MEPCNKAALVDIHLPSLPFPTSLLANTLMQSRDVLAGTPRLGILDTDGDWLERKTTESDVLVYADPAAIVAGDDRQLRRAVKVLLQELDSEVSP